MTQIAINNHNVHVVAYAGQRVITFKMMDELHERPDGTARRNFNANKAHLIEGEDYFVRNSSEARDMGFTAPNGLTLLSESGYTMLVKSFTDDLAWQVQKALVRSYFKPATAAPAIPQTYAEALLEAGRLAKERDALKAENLELAPKAAGLEILAEKDGELGIRDAGRELKVGQNRVRDMLFERKWACRQGRDIRPASYGLEHGYVRLVPRLYEDKRTGQEKISDDFRITRKGIARLAEIFGVMEAGSVRVPFSKAKEPTPA
ncbi:phage antirepressor KilAC domain-containing protein [Komagataeibacter diospyri]|uniref:KilA-N DNA-binding domain-containing protein n=1 Tax=Komagataeibacter diospyri TaxID=1932662 RepID=A0A4P5NLH6_9PROT|nr:phage antirepressor KilAC domain-containing protein [Komagataeibacter diospyri]GCE82213.1 hypothetical protein MSKU9_0354 [Komagataeibacter diospyri]